MHVELTTETASPRSKTRPTPRIEVFTERLLIDTDDGEREVTWPVLSLTFDYGSVVLAPRSEFDWREGAHVHDWLRHDESERSAQRALERFGAVELECVPGCAPPFGSRANYLVCRDPNPHTICSFTAHAIPQLERAGFVVEVAGDYPYQVVDGPSGFDISVDPLERKHTREDWFSLELGIDVRGERLSLVPALIEMLDQTPDGATLRSLATCPARFRALEIGSGRYFVIEWERLERILTVLRDMYDPDETAFDFLGTLVGALGRLERELTGAGARVTWRAPAGTIEAARELSEPPKWCAGPASLKATLRPYQEHGLNWLEQLRHHDCSGVLADDMGLGKTLQTIAHLTREKEARRTDLPTLVVMPTSLVGNWKREFEKFAPHLRVLVLHGKSRRERYGKIANAEVVITTYPVLIRDQQTFSAQGYHYVILDEAQAIKNPRSLATRVVKELGARHRLCLTGTPVENNLGELWSLFDFLMPGFLGTQAQFNQRFRGPIEDHDNADQLAVLRQRVAPFVLRRIKEEVAAELPGKTELVRAVELTGDQRDLYESIRAAAHGEVRQAIKKRGFAASSITILDALMKLRQVCCDPRLVAVEAARSVQQSAKLDMFYALLERQLAEGRRALVFSQFTTMLELLSRGLGERGITHLALTGKSNHRQRIVDAFEAGEADVFLISLKAGGTGLNLVSADTVIHFDPWWNAAAQMQATDRAYRIGQTKPVFVYNLIVSGSVEERMLQLQGRKRLLADTLLSQRRSEGQGLALDDIDDLFAPLD